MADITPKQARQRLQSAHMLPMPPAERRLREYARAYLAEHTRAERLDRILAVERGDESRAPEGWKRWHGSWRRTSGRICGVDRFRAHVSLRSGPDGFPSASVRVCEHDGISMRDPFFTASFQTTLEAIEAADKALEARNASDPS